MDVFCGDAWRIFEWELGCEALPMDYVNGYADHNLILNDAEFWDVPEMLSRTNPSTNQLSNTTNYTFEPSPVAGRDYRCSQKKRDRKMLTRTPKKEYPDHSTGVLNPQECFSPVIFATTSLPDSHVTYNAAPFTLEYITDGGNNVFVDKPLGGPENPLHTIPESVPATGAIYHCNPDRKEGLGVSDYFGLSEPRAKKTKTNATSQFKGVTKHRQTGKFEAHLWDATVIRRGKERRGRKRGKQIYLGGFTSELAAARTYDMAAICFWGDEAVTNFPSEDYAADRDLLKTTDKQSLVKILRRSGGGYIMGSQCFVGLTQGGFMDSTETSP